MIVEQRESISLPSWYPGVDDAVTLVPRSLFVKDLALPQGISGTHMEMICDSGVISEDDLGVMLPREKDGE